LSIEAQNAEEVVSASVPIVESTLSSAEVTEMPSQVEEPQLAIPVRETEIASGEKTPLGVPASTVDDQVVPASEPSQEEESLLKRVHDRAFSGDSIEGLPQVSPEETNATPSVTDMIESKELEKDVDAETKTEAGAVTVSPELVAVPITEDEPVLVMPELQLQPLESAREPDVIVIADNVEVEEPQVEQAQEYAETTIPQAEDIIIPEVETPEVAVEESAPEVYIIP